MKRSLSRMALVLGCALILVTDVLILASAAWNRRGAPRAELRLTERELAMPEYRQKENTGLVLSLVLMDQPPAAVRRAARRRRRELPPVDHPWLDRAKFRELGFRVGLDPTEPAAAGDDLYWTERRAWLVLELEGEAWRRWLTGREAEVRRVRREVENGTKGPGDLADAEKLLALDRTMRSRLFAVDAGTNPRALRQRYPDRRRYAVVKGLIRPRLVPTNEGKHRVTGRLWLLGNRVYVPRTLRKQLEPFLPEKTRSEVIERARSAPEAKWPSPVPPRYWAKLAFGRRHEPWLVSVGSDVRGSSSPDRSVGRTNHPAP